MTEHFCSLGLKRRAYLQYHLAVVLEQSERLRFAMKTMPAMLKPRAQETLDLMRLELREIEKLLPANVASYQNRVQPISRGTRHA